jgi:hypothetical protein
VERAGCFLGRGLGVVSLRGFRLPRTEKAFSVVCLSEGAAGVLPGASLLFSCCSHGKPGGEEGGVEFRVNASENVISDFCCGVEGGVSSDGRGT